GASLGVWPVNDPRIVAETIAAFGLDPHQPVTLGDGICQALSDVLSGREITRVCRKLTSWAVERFHDPVLAGLLGNEQRDEFTAYMHGLDLRDLAARHPNLRFTAQGLADHLRPLAPRLYSIASAPSQSPQHAELTVEVVHWHSHGRGRQGVASSWLGERLSTATPFACYVHPAKHFTLPADDVDLIMVGPGTGIAPFRSFLAERACRGAQGRNWLFFGAQHQACDYLYGDEIESWRSAGLLTHLSLAFSRDQAAKVYVQHLMWQQREEIWRWLDSGAVLAVCGDAVRMAKDVDDTLHRILVSCAGLSLDEAQAWISQAKKDERYIRDVYAV
ncbi:MAG: flavodoxin domain-containing protein, partial [Planctomycetota bacterium]